MIGEGVHGKVYKGALHGKWEVAIKIMTSNRGNTGSHLSLTGSHSGSRSSSRKSNSLSSGRKRHSSKSLHNRATGSLFDNDEVKFLMRT